MQLLLATRKRVFALLPPLCKREKICKQIGTVQAVTEGLLKSKNRCKTIPQPLRDSSLYTTSLSHIRTSCAYFSFNICLSVEPLLNHAIAWFSLYKNDGDAQARASPFDLFFCKNWERVCPFCGNFPRQNVQSVGLRCGGSVSVKLSLDRKKKF